jgi:OOP family OmpA-OmpF porin
VEGHTDDRGGLERNLKLSSERTEAVRNYLTEHFKIDPNRIKTQGFGYSRPRVPNDSKENMLKNRRVEILFVERTPTN